MEEKKNRKAGILTSPAPNSPLRDGDREDVGDDTSKERNLTLMPYLFADPLNVLLKISLSIDKILVTMNLETICTD